MQRKKSAARTGTTVPRSRDSRLIRSPHRAIRTCSRHPASSARRRSISRTRHCHRPIRNTCETFNSIMVQWRSSVARQSGIERLHRAELVSLRYPARPKRRSDICSALRALSITGDTVTYNVWSRRRLHRQKGPTESLDSLGLALSEFDYRHVQQPGVHADRAAGLTIVDPMSAGNAFASAMAPQGQPCDDPSTVVRQTKHGQRGRRPAG